MAVLDITNGLGRNNTYRDDGQDELLQQVVIACTDSNRRNHLFPTHWRNDRTCAAA